MKSKVEKRIVDLVRCAGGANEPLAEIMLTPWGLVKSFKGDFTVDDESAREVIATFDAEKKDIPIDYEHTTVGGNYATADGRAPAAGWITKIIAKPGEGLFALVKWNEAAIGMIKRDEYRFLSPVLSVRRDDKKVMAVTSAALTNKPAILDMERVAARDDGERTMDLKALRLALAAAGITLADDASDELVIEAACKFASGNKAVQDAATAATALAASVRTKLGVAADATKEVIVAKVAELQTAVPASEYKVVTARLEALETASKDREGQELVAYSIETAKLNPNHEASMRHAREWAKRDPVAFKAWSEAAPALYTAGRVVKPDAKLDKKEGRVAIIASAREEFKGERTLGGFTTEEAFVNDALREANETKLGKDELK